jgi:hypothetical protein
MAIINIILDGLFLAHILDQRKHSRNPMDKNPKFSFHGPPQPLKVHLSLSPCDQSVKEELNPLHIEVLLGIAIQG